MKALTFSTFGGPEVLEYTDIADPTLKPGEILVEMKAIGLNFADIYRRKGNYHLEGSPPFIAGYEGAGLVVDSNGSSLYKIGDRVAFADVPLANAQLVAVPMTHAIRLPEDISYEVAASVLLQGLTAYYLANDSHHTMPGEKVLIHAAAGGVGQLLTQMSKLLGAIVFGVTSSEAKTEVTLSSGADHVFLYEDWQQQVVESTGGIGVDVVYDSIGSTLLDSLAVTKPGGKVVFYGMSGGEPPCINPRLLMDSSKTLAGGDLWNYLSSLSERTRRASQIFEWVRDGKIKIQQPTLFNLSEGRLAHEYLESRKSTGKILLIP